MGLVSNPMLAFVWGCGDKKRYKRRMSTTMNSLGRPFHRDRWETRPSTLILNLVPNLVSILLKIYSTYDIYTLIKVAQWKKRLCMYMSWTYRKFEFFYCFFVWYCQFLPARFMKFVSIEWNYIFHVCWLSLFAIFMKIQILFWDLGPLCIWKVNNCQGVTDVSYLAKLLYFSFIKFGLLPVQKNVSILK